MMIKKLFSFLFYDKHSIKFLFNYYSQKVKMNLMKLFCVIFKWLKLEKWFLSLENKDFDFCCFIFLATYLVGGAGNAWIYSYTSMMY